MCLNRNKLEDTQEPNVEDFVSSADCPECGGTGYPNPTQCAVCEAAWEVASERCRDFYTQSAAERSLAMKEGRPRRMKGA